MGACICAVTKGDGVARAADVFLNDDAGRAVGDGRAGEDAHRLRGADDAGPCMAGACLTDDGETVAGGGIALQRIAIHRRGREGGLIARRHDGARKDAARRMAQGDGFHIQRADKGEAFRQRLFDRNHGAASNRPDLPPSFIRRRIPSICMPFSAALSMS